jgi:hypothetical protein
MDWRADAAFEAAANLAHETKQERTAQDHGDDLDDSDEDLGHDPGKFAHATTTRTITRARRP